MRLGTRLGSEWHVLANWCIRERDVLWWEVRSDQSRPRVRALRSGFLIISVQYVVVNIHVYRSLHMNILIYMLDEFYYYIWVYIMMTISEWAHKPIKMCASHPHIFKEKQTWDRQHGYYDDHVFWFWQMSTDKNWSRLSKQMVLNWHNLFAVWSIWRKFHAESIWFRNDTLDIGSMG